MKDKVIKLRNDYSDASLTVKTIQKGTDNIAVIVGNGNSVFVDDVCRPKKIKGYKNSTIFAIYYPQTSEEMVVTERELAEFINKEFMLYKKIILHGYSECGLAFLRIYKQLDTWTKLRTHVVSVSASMKEICLGSILKDMSEYGYEYKNNIHIVVSKPSHNSLTRCYMVPFKDQIPDCIYDQITVSSVRSAMHKSCKFVRTLM